MSWQYSPLALPLIIASIVSAGLAILARQRRDIPGSTPFYVLMLGVFVWSLSATFELVSVDLVGKILSSKAQYIGIVTVLFAWPIFVFQYTKHEKWITTRTIAFLVIEPVIALCFVWTNELHGLIWPSTTLTNTESLIVLEVGHGIVFWLHAIYGYFILLMSTVLLAREMIRSGRLYRGQFFVLLIAAIVPWVGNVLFLAGLSIVDLTPFAFTITALALAWGLFRFRLLDIVPVARDAVIESLTDGVLVMDAQYRIVDLNTAAQKLLDSKVRHKVQQVIGQSLEQALPSVYESLQQNKQIAAGQAELLLPQGDSERHFELRFASLYNRANHLTGRVAILQDITERKQAAQRIQHQNEALAQANHELLEARRQAEDATRLKSQFLATMSHELRTPLNAIIGYTEIQLAGMTGALNQEQQNYQTRVLANADHLLRLINEILDLSKIEAGRTEIVRKPFVVRDWLNEVIQQTEGLAQQKGLRFEHSIDEHIPPALIGDPARLKQIAINLLSNAIKFTEEGYVKIEVRQHGADTWTILVNDSGIGIPPHMQEIVFEEFRQIDGSTRRNYGGTGLGLAIVRKLVLMMGGNVRLNSQVGEGTTFTVSLPLVEHETPMVETVSTSL